MKACRSRNAAQGNLLGFARCSKMRFTVNRVVPIAQPRLTHNSSLLRGSIRSRSLMLLATLVTQRYGAVAWQAEVSTEEEVKRGGGGGGCFVGGWGRQHRMALRIFAVTQHIT